ncbi:MAG: Zn-ribbon domain-containing OB-fold protein [Candidatus Dormibacteraeota bacterium]|nr:Zn-ribbon domain-containing OB-fold protein [Candidatus Dormibacteraeota bacterium]
MTEATTTTTAAARPGPRFPEPDTEPFWAATREGRLTYQVCRRCGGIVFHPRRHCTHCTSLELDWRTSAGKGTVYSFTVIRQHGHPFFRGRVPYVVAFIDLDEGFRMLAEVEAPDPSQVRIGQRVEVRWEDGGEVRIPLFVPASDEGAGAG